MDFIARPMPLPVAAHLPADAAVKRLFNFNHKHIEDCTQVKAAIAYGSRDNMELLNACRKHQKKLDFYGRYDGSCPIDPHILRWFLDCKSPSIQCRVVPKYLHAKVVWWVGSGAYVGSANMTDRAWNVNFEAGVFLLDAELEHFGLIEELTAFFDGIHANSYPLNEERYNSQLELWKAREKFDGALRKLEEDFDKNDALLSATDSPIAAVPAKNANVRFQHFAAEWEETLQHMRDVADRVVVNRPDWVREDVPKGVQADQFLHTFYDEMVRPGSEKDAHERFFDRNHRNPEQALKDALVWWRSGSYKHDDEERTIYKWAPITEKAFAKDAVLTLSKDEWVEAAIRVHSLGDHAAKVPNKLLGLPESRQDQDTKKEAFALWLWEQRSEGGKSILQTIHHVVWGSGDLTRRLWAGCNDPEWKIAHVRTSTLGEIIGWANPTIYPPRNMRTSKGLRALGFNVNVNL